MICVYVYLSQAGRQHANIVEAILDLYIFKYHAQLTMEPNECQFPLQKGKASPNHSLKKTFQPSSP